MYVDRYRFSKEPDYISELQDGHLRALFRKPRSKVGVALRYLRHAPAIFRAYSALANRESRRTFVDLLNFRMLGPPYTKLVKNRELFLALEGVMDSQVPSTELPFPMEGQFGDKIQIWSVSYKDRPLEVIGGKYGLYWMLRSDQYYYRVGAVAIQPEPGDVILDGGAFLGEISLRFAIDAGPDGRVYGFDPFPLHVQLAADNARQNGLQDRLGFFAAGLAGKSNVTGLDGLGPPEAPADSAPSLPGSVVHSGRRMEAGDASIAIDDFCEWKGLDKVDYIKMDIEGSEADALLGCHRTIMKWRPKLAICVYHRFGDLWTITNEIRSRYPFYQLYLGHHSLHAEETVLYAIAPAAPASA